MYYMKLSIIVSTVLLIGCGTTQDETVLEKTSSFYESNNSLYNHRNIEALNIDFKSTIAKNNAAAYVTSQCYTKTTDDFNNTYNPCFSCHINSIHPNYVDDWVIQEEAGFGEYSKINRYTNLFKDRSSLVSEISDEEISAYVKEDNYIQKGKILLAHKLKNPPADWEVNSDKKWNGYTPDSYFDFDDEGFDRKSDGTYTLWRAFAYYPFLGTFWPTNGSTDDVLIRMPQAFSQDANQTFNLDVYKLNLAIVESLIKQKNIAIAPVNELKYGVDIDQNGVLSTANEVVFTWEKPSYDSATGKITNFSMQYVGYAKELLRKNDFLIAPGLYPQGTEFLHSVRYLDEDGTNVKMAPRMKELRYAKKIEWITYSQISNAVLTDIKEKDAFPDRLRTVHGNTEYGALNNLGWIYQGFIEDAKGELRPQNYEETLYCIGCHSGIGSIADSTFAFQRKLDTSHFQSGWFHWSQKDNAFKNLKEPKTPDNRGEYSLYLEVNHAGDEFRANDEVIAKFFDANGSLIQSQLDILKNDVSTLLIPSIQRARTLNKAYKIIVEEQSYIYGRDPHVRPVTTVYKEIDADKSTKLKATRYDLTK